MQRDEINDMSDTIILPGPTQLPTDRTPGLVTRPIRNQAELKALVEAAAGDNHVPLFPTHLVWRGGEIVGYLSLLNTPVVNYWSHSQKMRGRESLEFIRWAEAMAACQVPQIIVPCAVDSPFFKLMPEMGYTLVGHTAFFVKKL
jgi:hypothetical protein